MANALQELVLRIGGDSSGGQQAVRDLSSALASTLTKALQDTGTKAEESGQKVSGFAKYLEGLKPSTDNAHASFSDLRGTLTEMWTNPTAAVGKFASAIGTDLSGALASTGGSLAALGVAAGGVVAVLGVAALAAFELAKRSAETGARLDDLHDATGMSVEALSRLSNAAKVLGGDVKSLSDLVFKMQQRMGENPEEFAKGLERIGLDFEDFKRLAPEEQLEALSTALQQTADYAERNAAGTALMGKGFRDLAPTLYDLNTALDLTKDITPWTAEQAAQAEQFDMQLKSIAVHFNAIADSLGRMALPPVMAMLSLVLRWAESESTKMLMQVAAMLGPGAIGINVPQFNAATIKPVASHGAAEHPVGQIVGTTDQEMFKLLEGLDREQHEARLKRLEALKKAKADALKAEFDDEQKAQDASYDLELHMHQQVMKLAEKQAEADKKLREVGLAAHNKFITDSVNDIERMVHLQEDANLSVADAQVRAIERRRDAEIQAVEQIIGLEGHLKDERIRLIKETTQAEIDNIDTVSNWWKGGVEHSMMPPTLNPQITDTTRLVTELGQSFVQMAQLGTNGFGDIVGLIGQVIVGLEQARRAKELIANSSWGSAQGATNKIQGYAALYGGAVMSGANATTGGTDEQGRPTTFSETMNSAMNWKSASTYTAAVSTLGISLAVQAAAGYIKYLFRDRTLEDAARDAGEKFGTVFSKSTMDAIQKAKDAGYRVVTAEMLNLDKIINDAGGLTDKNLTTFNARFHDLFSFIELGWMTATEAAAVFEQNFATYLAANTDAVGRISDEMAAIIDLANDAQFGVNSAALQEWMKSQASNMAAGLGDLLTQPLVTSGAAIKKAVDDAQAALEALKATGTTTADALTQAQDVLTAALSAQHVEAVRNKQALDDLATVALTTFNAAIASGQTFAQALQGIGPSLDIIKHAFDDLGLSIDDVAVRGLVLEHTILNGAGGTGKAIAGLQALVTAGMNLGRGVETPEAFAAQQRTMASVYTQTQAATASAGGTTINALLPFQQTLHQMEEWAKKNGQELDASTRQMIDQSRELSIWNDDFKTDSEQTRESIADLIASNTALAEALGGLPAALAAAVNGGRTLTADGSGVESFARGSGGIRDFGSGTRAWLHGREAVVPEDQLAPLYPFLPALGGSFDIRLPRPTPSPVPEGPFLPGNGGRFLPGASESAAPVSVTKTYNIVITARNDDAAEQWRDWMRSEGVDIAVEELEDGRFVSRLNRALDR